MRAVEIETEASDRSGARIFVLQLIAGGLLAATTVVLLFEGIRALREATAEPGLTHYLLAFAASAAVAVVVGLIVRRRAEAQIVRLRTQLGEREQVLTENRMLLDSVLEHAPAGLVVVDKDHNVLHANQHANRVHSAADMANRSCKSSCEFAGSECDECPTSQALESKEVQPTRPRTFSRSGETIQRGVYPLALPVAGDSVLVVDEIITEQQRLRAHLAHQGKMAAFGLVAAGIAHDMGNPLSAIQMHVQLLQEEALPEDASSSLRIVGQEVERLRRSLKELVDSARRRGSDAATLVSPEAVLTDTLRLISHDRRMRAVSVTIDADETTPMVFIVEDHFAQVVLNLLINALDAMPRGGRLRVELRSIAGEVALRVHDDGIGMDAATLRKCKEPMFTTKAPGKGTGLGLSITQDILRDAGGKLEMHSVPDGGTTAIVRLPAASLQERDADDIELRVG